MAAAANRPAPYGHGLRGMRSFHGGARSFHSEAERLKQSREVLGLIGAKGVAKGTKARNEGQSGAPGDVRRVHVSMCAPCIIPMRFDIKTSENLVFCSNLAGTRSTSWKHSARSNFIKRAHDVSVVYMVRIIYIANQSRNCFVNIWMTTF